MRPLYNLTRGRVVETNVVISSIIRAFSFEFPYSF